MYSALVATGPWSLALMKSADQPLIKATRLLALGTGQAGVSKLMPSFLVNADQGLLCLIHHLMDQPIGSESACQQVV
jgi:hypothetical protein